MSGLAVQPKEDQDIRARFGRILLVVAVAAPILVLIESYLLGVSGWLLGNLEVIIISCMLGWLYSFSTAFLFGIPICAVWLWVFRILVRRGCNDRTGACIASIAASILAAYAGLLVTLFTGSILESDPGSSAPSLLRLNKVAMMIFVPVAVTAVVASWMVFSGKDETGGTV